MNTFLKWITESISLVRAIFIFLLTALAYLFTPDTLDAQFIAKNPEFAPPGTLKFIVIFGTTYVILFCLYRLWDTLIAQSRQNIKRHNNQQQIAQITQHLRQLNEAEQQIIETYIKSNFQPQQLMLMHPAVITLEQKGIITRHHQDWYHFTPNAYLAIAQEKIN